jgi:hypothetical protein
VPYAACIGRFLIVKTGPHAGYPDNYQKLTLLDQLASRLASYLKNISLLEQLEQEISTA